MPPADNIPDLDSMTPEEVMSWMESLAKRQGASSEGFTTKADMEIAEIDPSTVEIDEPGYVPFGQEAPKKPASKPAASKSPAPQPAAPPPTPVTPPAPPPLPVVPVTPVPLPMMESDDQDTVPVSSVELSGLAWLESLAADQQSTDFPQIDLSSLSAEIQPSISASEPATNPLDWLTSLAENQDEIPAEPTFSAAEITAAEESMADVTDPLAAGIDPMLWLESLAKRQGAKAEELTTAANYQIPTPENAIPSGPGYTDFTIESETSKSGIPAKADATDPNEWLASIAGGEGFGQAEADSSMSDQDIQKALSVGSDIAPDQIAAFFERQMSRGLETEEPELLDIDDYDPDAPAVPAEIPDWLLEQVQPPMSPEPPALSEVIVEPPAVSDLPDWLKDDVSTQSASELESIFESEEASSVPTPELAIDLNDPWVEAFNEEQDQNASDTPPDWYERNIKDPKRIAAVEGLIQGGTESKLEDVPLEAETELAPGEPQAIPDWLSDATADDVSVPDWLTAGVTSSTQEDISMPEQGEMPDWLKEAAVTVDPTDIPGWLVDTVETEEVSDLDLGLPPAPAPLPAAPPPPPAPVITPVPAAPAPVSPAPVLVAAALDVGEALKSAREKYTGGDLDGSLREYESVIRANQSLEAVVTDMTTMAEHHKDNPTVYRVLGDSLMRVGKLQAALDTYRKALNQL